MTEEQGQELRKLRYGIGADILKAMEKAGDLPLPNVRILAKEMQRTFKEGEFAEELGDKTWRPKPGYWIAHLEEIRRVLREGKLYFEYSRPQGEFKGLWKFVTKEEYVEILAREYQGLSSLAENYNERLDDSKWKIPLPHVADIRRLEASTRN